MPVVTYESDYTPSTYNDPNMTTRVMKAVGDSIGDKNILETPPSMGGEDFSQFHRYDREIPTVIFWTGGADPVALAKAMKGEGEIPSANHSPFFAPIAEPALKLGVQSMTAGAVELFKAK